MASQDFLIGKLLIAMPNMTDPRFEKSLVLVCGHDRSHAMGVIVNKPLRNVELGELLEQLSIDPKPGASGDPVFYGGPVRAERGLVVHSLDYRLPSTIVVTAELGLTGSQEILTDIAGVRPKRKGPQRSRLLVGHAGWSAGQLENEISANGWVHSNAEAALIFEREGDEAWRAALEALGVTEAMFSAAWSRARRSDELLN